MEVETAIPQLAWNGHGNHTPNNTHHLADINDNEHSSNECDGLTASDNSDSLPPLPTTSPPDYYSHTESRNNLSDLRSDLQSHSNADNSPQSNTHHNVAISEATKQAKALSDGEMYSNSDDDDEEEEELGVLQQLKSCSASKLMQLQQVQVMDDNDGVSTSQTAHLGMQDNSQAEILRLRKV